MNTYKIGILFDKHGNSDDKDFMELCQEVDANADGQTQYELVRLYPEDMVVASTKINGLCGTLLYSIHCTAKYRDSIMGVLAAVASAGNSTAHNISQFTK